MLVAKNLSNPVNVSVGTILRGAKEVVRNGRKALSCAKDAESEYKDGKLPSGKTLSPIHPQTNVCEAQRYHWLLNKNKTNYIG
jgi:hypothetical protein